MNIQILLNRKYYLLIIFCILFTNKGSCQIIVSKRAQVCNCFNIKLKNKSNDTVYVISQSFSILYKDTCFAYTVFKREKKNGYTLNLSYYDDGVDGYSSKSNNRHFYLYPDSTLFFGARTNEIINSDSLFVSMFVFALPIKKSKGINIIEKNKLRTATELWKWETYYCGNISEW